MRQEFLILVSAAPLKTQSHITAMKFIRQSVLQNITIKAIFFYKDAVLIANKMNSPPSDEPQLHLEWQEIGKTYQIELQTCVAASFKRGILDDHEATDQGLGQSNLNENFHLVGLGQLAAAMNDKQVKLIHFK